MNNRLFSTYDWRPRWERRGGWGHGFGNRMSELIDDTLRDFGYERWRSPRWNEDNTTYRRKVSQNVTNSDGTTVCETKIYINNKGEKDEYEETFSIDREGNKEVLKEKGNKKLLEEFDMLEMIKPPTEQERLTKGLEEKKSSLKSIMEKQKELMETTEKLQKEIEEDIEKLKAMKSKEPQKETKEEPEEVEL